MTTPSPILDLPQSIDYDLLPPGPINRLANQELLCAVDAATDVYDVTWPWAGAVYARSIRLTISDWQDGVLTPLVTRCFPGHQETIAGAEGMIVTKRVIVPWKSPDDRALLWLLECQAEGDRLLRLEVAIDWGEPLTQRMVDGLLVAQRNPGPERGIYSQSNAESTRVFGDPHGRPDEVDLADPQRARLVYHVLVNGIVEVPLLLTLSDVGEQVAWNGFLALRDVEQLFDAGSSQWAGLLRSGRLWTPDTRFNAAVDAARLVAVRGVQHLRTGWAPTTRRTQHIAPLVAAWDAIDPIVSRNLLAHLRRAAEQGEGRLPALLPLHPKAARVVPPPNELAAGNSSYLAALHHHFQHHGDAAWLAEHGATLAACAEALLRLRWEAPAVAATPAAQAEIAAGLGHAVALAAALGDAVNVERWRSELDQMAAAPYARPPKTFGLAGWAERYGWHAGSAAQLWRFDDELAAAQLVSDAIFRGCGIRRGDTLAVAPTWPASWRWWALLGLGLTDGKRLSLLWDGATLHATQPVTSALPVRLWQRIQLHGAGEFDFNPFFELTPSSHSGDTAQKERFRPIFHS
jgi:hypothetical protein